MLQTLKHWFKQDTVLCIAWLLAIGTMFLVPPSMDYVGYIDFHTLGLLFALMAVMALGTVGNIENGFISVEVGAVTLAALAAGLALTLAWPERRG